jgi:acylpyruvate hydrolase
VRFATVVVSGASRAAVSVGEDWRALPASDLSELLSSRSLDAAGHLAGDALPDAMVALPLPSPTKVVCCGLNYTEHIAETRREFPTYPTLFTKYADMLIGPTDDLLLPRGLQLDWEAELAVVVGSTLSRADRATAFAGIAGYTVANDISIRDWQRRTSEWFQGKAWDATTPVGPVVVTPNELDPMAGIDVVCRLNGEEVQRGNTKTLVFDAADLLAYISTFTPLRPGDLVLTGTPGGVGMARDPQRFLADGDVVETEIDGIGKLRTAVRFTG